MSLVLFGFWLTCEINQSGFLFAFEVFLHSKVICQFYIIIKFLHSCWKFSSTACTGVYIGGGGALTECQKFIFKLIKL